LTIEESGRRYVLDLVVTSEDTTRSTPLSLAVTDLLTSDHCLVTFCLPFTKPSALQTKYTCRRCANFDIDEFDRELAASELATTDSLDVNYLFE